MIFLTATEARKSFFELIKQSNQQHEIFNIQHKSGNAIMMSSEEYENLQETLQLLSQPGFSQALEESIRQADAGDLVTFDDVFGEKQ